MYNIFYEFFADYIFTDATIRDLDAILHYSSLVSCILVLIALFAVIRALLKLLSDDSNKRRKWL